MMNKKYNLKHVILNKIAYIFFVILICDINRAERADFPAVDFSSSTSIRMEDISFMWTLKNITIFRMMEKGHFIWSPIFSLASYPELRYYVRLYPSQYDDPDTMGVYLFPYGNHVTTYIQLTIMLMNKFCEIPIEYVYYLERHFYENDTCGFGVGNVVKREDVFDPEKNLTLDDTLTIIIEMNIEIDVVDNIQHDDIGNYNFSNNPLTKHFERFRNKSRFADVMLVMGEDRLPAHAILLAAHSTLLGNSIISHESKIKSGQFVELPMNDIKVDVMEEVLKYIYTNSEKIPILEEQILKNCTSCFINWSKDIYDVSHKYKITRLKRFCEKYIFENLNVDTAIGILTYMKSFKAKNIILKIMKFIAYRISDFINTYEFKKFKVSHPKLVAKIFQISARYEGEICLI